jgi:hypothetical protein
MRGGLHLFGTAYTRPMTFHFGEIVGRYRLVVSPELLEFVERAFVEPAPPAERDTVRAEALHEAAGAELEITPDGRVISRSHDQQFYCIALPGVETECEDRAYEELRFEKGPSSPVSLRLVDGDTVHATQPGKPLAVFRRI